MNSDWKTAPLGDLTDLVIDYRGKTPKKLGADWSASGYRALSAKNIKTGHIVQPETIRYVDKALYDKWMKEEVQRGDILITSEAPFGQVYYWNSDEKIVLSQRLFGVRVRPGFSSEYVYYYMTSQAFQGELAARATGTTVTGLRQPELLKCPIHYPNLDAQERIATILSNIDGMIQTNNRINDNLEQQAQAIFKNWFIDNPEATDWPTISFSRACSHESLSHHRIQAICTVTRNVAVFLAYLVAIDRQDFSFKKAFSTRWRNL